MQNYYEIIGVKSNSDFSLIKAEYLNKIKKYHPDLYEGDKLFAQQMTTKLNEAYNVLKDEQKRKDYDLKLKKHKKCFNIKNFFVKTIKTIKNFFILIFKNKSPENKLSKRELQEKRKLNIIIFIQIILIIVLFVLVIIT